MSECTQTPTSKTPSYLITVTLAGGRGSAGQFSTRMCGFRKMPQSDTTWTVTVNSITLRRAVSWWSKGIDLLSTFQPSFYEAPGQAIRIANFAIQPEVTVMRLQSVVQWISCRTQTQR